MRKQFLLHLLVFFTISYSFGQALRFNGSSNYVNLSNDPALHLQNFTLEAWINIMGTGATTGTAFGNEGGFKSSTVVPIIAKGRREKGATATTSINYFMGYRPSDMKLVADFEDNTSGAHHTIVGKRSLASGSWVHVAATYSTTTHILSLYVNGSLDASLSLGGNYIPQSLSTIKTTVGTALNASNAAEGFFNGKIDEVRIWNVARSSAEISGNYTLEVTSGTGLAGRYGFNDGSGTVAKNSIATTSNGTLVNSPQWTTGYFASTTNLPPNAPASPSPTNGATSVSTSPNLCVSVSDPESNQLRVRYYGRKKQSTSGKFTIILLPDTQFYTSVKNGGNNEMFKSQTKWVADNRASRNIVYTGQLGDCTDHGDTYVAEWKRADTAIRTLEDATLTGLTQGIPYGICVGNHDQSPNGDPNGTTNFYNQYFGEARFSTRSYYGGHYGSNNDNHFQLFSAGGIDFLVISFEYNQTTSFATAGGPLDWGESLIKAYPNRKVIVMSHFVMDINAIFSSQGSYIYNRYKNYSNFILLIGAHIVDGDGEVSRSDTYNGNTVHTLVSNYQARTNGGNGRLRIMEFDPSNNNVSIQTYSPYTNTYETDANSQFNISVNLSTPPAAYTLIGEVNNVASGSTACAAWPSLQAGSQYEWYAEAWDGVNTTTSPTWSFTTSAPTLTTVSADRIPTEEITETASSLFTVFPNPNNTDRFTLSFHKMMKGEVSMEVYDMAGKLQFKKTYQNIGSTMSEEHHLHPGIYTLVVTTKDSIETRKLVIIR